MDAHEPRQGARVLRLEAEKGRERVPVVRRRGALAQVFVPDLDVAEGASPAPPEAQKLPPVVVRGLRGGRRGEDEPFNNP